MDFNIEDASPKRAGITSENIVEAAAKAVLALAWLVRSVVAGTTAALLLFVPIAVLIAILFPQPSLYRTPLSQISIGMLLPQPYSPDEIRRSTTMFHARRKEQAQALLDAHAIGLPSTKAITPKDLAILTAATSATYDVEADVQKDQLAYFSVLFQALALVCIVWKVITTRP